MQSEARTVICPFSHPVPVPGAVPKATGRVRIDRAVLRRDLVGVAEIREAMTSKLTGRPSANVCTLWLLLTRSVYRSGDPPWLAKREAAQNRLYPARAAIHARQIKAGEGCCEVIWDAAEGWLTWTENGIGMSAEDIIGEFLAIGESGGREAYDQARRVTSASPMP